MEEMKLQCKLDRMFLRNLELQDCKTQAEKDKLLDRWTSEDNAEKVADSINDVASAIRNKHGFLGIF